MVPLACPLHNHNTSTMCQPWPYSNYFFWLLHWQSYYYCTLSISHEPTTYQYNLDSYMPHEVMALTCKSLAQYAVQVSYISQQINHIHSMLGAWTWATSSERKSSERKVRKIIEQVRKMVEQIREVNITQNGQMLKFNSSSYDSFPTEP